MRITSFSYLQSDNLEIVIAWDASDRATRYTRSWELFALDDWSWLELDGSD